MAEEQKKPNSGIGEKTGEKKQTATKEQKKLSSAFLRISVLPLIFLSIVVVMISSNLVSNALQREIKRELKNTAAFLEVSLDRMYDGNYQMVEVNEGKALAFNKGDDRLSGEYPLLDQYKASTEQEISIFYKDTRVLTTLTDGEGNRLTGTVAHAKIVNDVLSEDHEAFYTNVEINGEEYYAYYRPLYNETQEDLAQVEETGAAAEPGDADPAAGETTAEETAVEESQSTGSDAPAQQTFGMIGIAKPKREIRSTVWESILPIILISAVALVLAAFGASRYSKGLLTALSETESFLDKVAAGKLNSKLSAKVTGRKDEIGKMGRAAIAMQNSLSELIERDVLTGLYNRRYGGQKLKATWATAAKTGIPFALAIADIDFFKKVNDTYGHEAGDVVLKEVSETMRRRMPPGGTVIRWGGEEFLLLFEGIEMEDAIISLEAIRKEIEENMIVYERKVIRVTMTAGITKGTTERGIDEVITLADEKLYEGKQAGRNCVMR
ncbi:MAG: diguanylate cyclase [Lachnospiraceae bacterium]|nr:diguanylate cyclase [Lachnospiraceae bacterium]